MKRATIFEVSAGGVLMVHSGPYTYILQIFSAFKCLVCAPAPQFTVPQFVVCSRPFFGNTIYQNLPGTHVLARAVAVEAPKLYNVLLA